MRVALACLLLILFVAPASGMTMPAPGRPLTPDEVIAQKAHHADRILVGRILSEYDTTVVRGPHSGLATFQHVRFAPERTLKGSSSRREIAFCSLPPDQDVLGPAGRRGPDRPGYSGTLLLYVHRPDYSRNSPEDTYGGAVQRSCRWVSLPAEPSGPGLVAWTKEEEVKVRQAVARQSIEALIRGADRIVLGRVLPLSNTTASKPFAAPHTQPPRTIAVVRTLKGTPRARVDVQPVIPVWCPGGSVKEPTTDFLWLLRRAPNGALEPVELLAGIVVVQGGRVPAWGMSLDAAIERIQSLRPN